MKLNTKFKIRKSMRYAIAMLLVLNFTQLFSQMEIDGTIYYGNEWIDYDKSYIKIEVSKDGIYAVSRNKLDSLGLPSSIALDELSLYHNGEKVQYLPENSRNRILFYGKKNRTEVDRFMYEADSLILNPEYSLINDASAYFITWGEEGEMYDVVETEMNSGNLSPETYYLHEEINVFSDVHYKPVWQDNVQYSNFVASEGYGTGVKNVNTVNVGVSNLISSGPSTKVSIRFGGNNRAHKHQIYINNDLKEEISLGGNIDVNERTFTLNNADVGDNITFKIQGGFSPEEDKNIVAFAKAIYPRSYDLSGNPFLKMTIPAGSKKYIELENATSESYLLDLTHGRIIQPIEENNLLTFIIPSSNEPSEIIYCESSQIIESYNSSLRTFTNYLQPESEFILISHKKLGEGSQNYVEQYSQYRSSDAGGAYNTLNVDIEELYDQFAFGVDRHAIAIRNFAFWMQEKFDNPRYLFLVGKGKEYRYLRTADQENGFENFYIPAWGVPASDNLFVTTTDNRVPIMSIGRLAAKSSQEVKVYLDKIIEHDENRFVAQDIAGKLWQKNILHLSGGDPNLQARIADNLAEMEDTIKATSFAPNVTTFYKTSQEAIEVATTDLIFDRINEGVSLLTFFGHSTVGVFDFSIDNIDKYNNKGRYPLLLSLGCYSGNINTNTIGISEQFVLAENRGSINFIASSGTAYVREQFFYGKRFYNVCGGSRYQESIGEMLTKVINDFAAQTNIQMVTFLQQITLHGDPAVHLLQYEYPDFVPDGTTIKTNPTFIDTYEEDYEICLKISNLGRAIEDSINVNIIHLNPANEIVTDTTVRTLSPRYTDEFCVRLPLVNNSLVGLNTLKIKVDSDDEITEGPIPEGEMNNILVDNNGNEGYKFYILNNSATPIFPVNYSIVNEPDVTLVASTYNAVGEPQRFYIQIDTTKDFNSSMFKEHIIDNASGMFKWNLDFELSEGQEYFWRVSPDEQTTGVGFVWEYSSFIYEPNSRDGWNQSHFQQFEEDEFDNMFIDDKNKQSFAPNVTEITINNKVREEGLPPQFIINNAFQSSMFKWGSGPLIGVSVLDTLGKWWFNSLEGDYGSINPNSAPKRTFYYKLDSEQSRIDLVNFIEDVIPENHYVFFYTVFRDINSEFYVPEWKQDSLANNGRHIFKTLKNQGAMRAEEMDELGKALPYSFIFKKDISPLEEGIASDPYNGIRITEGIPGFWYEGNFTSDFIGPAKSWDEFVFTLDDENNLDTDTAYFEIIAFDNNKSGGEVVVSNLMDGSFDLSSINASEYPYLKVKYYALDNVNVDPVQLKQWRVYYTGYPDLSVNTVDNYSFHADSLQQGDILKLDFNISNFSGEDMGPSEIDFIFKDEENAEIKVTESLEAIDAQSSIPFEFSYDTRQLLGDYTFQFNINSKDNPKETYRFNNFGLGQFHVYPDKTNPLLDVTFDGVRIMDMDIVSAKPFIRIELKDENEFILLENAELFSLTLTDPNENQQEISLSDPSINFIPAENTDNNIAVIEFQPTLDFDGIYKLSVSAEDESENESGKTNYAINFRVYKEEMVSNVFNYPNPFSTSTQFIFTLTGDEEPSNILIRIMTLSGKVVREITMAELGNVHIGLNKTEFNWDGTDEYGSKLGNGVYLYQVITKKSDGSNYDKFTDSELSETDKFFKEGFGKLVIMR